MRERRRPDLTLLKIPLEKRLLATNLADFNSTQKKIIDPDRRIREIVTNIVIIFGGILFGSALLYFVNRL